MFNVLSLIENNVFFIFNALKGYLLPITPVARALSRCLRPHRARRALRGPSTRSQPQLIQLPARVAQVANTTPISLSLLVQSVPREASHPQILSSATTQRTIPLRPWYPRSSPVLKRQGFHKPRSPAFSFRVMLQVCCQVCSQHSSLVSIATALRSRLAQQLVHHGLIQMCGRRITFQSKEILR